MVVENVNSDVAKELFMVLSYCDSSLIDNIPKSVLKTISNLAADSTKEFYIDKNKPLQDQLISDECKDLLGMLYYKYMADSISKNEILSAWSKNEND